MMRLQADCFRLRCHWMNEVLLRHSKSYTTCTLWKRESPDGFLLLALFNNDFSNRVRQRPISLHVVDRQGNAATTRVFNGSVNKLANALMDV